MGAIIKNVKGIGEEIKDYLDKELKEAADSVSHCMNDGDIGATYKKKKDAVYVGFPMFDIFGNFNDIGNYEGRVCCAFKELKSKFPNIAIAGEVYWDETYSEYTYGCDFYCASNEDKLHVTHSPKQTCIICWKSYQYDVFFNSSQYENSEGPLNCICCPTCMLIYLVKEEPGYFRPIPSWFTDEELDELYDSDDYEQDLYEMTKKKFLSQLELYTPDFTKNEDKIQKLLQTCKSLEWKDIILQVLENVRQFKEKWALLDESKFTEYPFGKCINKGYVEIPLNSKILNSFLKENGLTIKRLEDICNLTRNEIINRQIRLDSIKCKADALLLIIKMYYFIASGKDELLDEAIKNITVNDIGNDEERSSNYDVKELSLIFGFIVNNREKISDELGAGIDIFERIDCEIRHINEKTGEGEYLLIKASKVNYFNNRELVNRLINDESFYNEFMKEMSKYKFVNYGEEDIELTDNDSFETYASFIEKEENERLISFFKFICYKKECYYSEFID